MAVSFKVPASPKKNILTIDEFLGVDFTNTGSNIEEVRSPNAENMVRLVPGKVRKRMGYSIPVDFSAGEDVNRVVGSSEEYVELFTDSNEHTFSIYDEVIPTVAYVFYKIDAVGTYESHYIKSNGTESVNTFTYTADNPRHTRHSFGVHSNLTSLKFVKVSNDPDDYFKIAELRICHKTKATTASEWVELPWKPAPEDIGNVFIKRDHSDSIFGHHALKLSSQQGNLVANVNRALGTSDAFSTFTVGLMYKLGETIPYDKEVVVSFEYDSASSAEMIFGPEPVSATATPIASLTGSGVFLNKIKLTSNASEIRLIAGTVRIKNFMVCYERTSGASWSAAPEDNGNYFDTSEVYKTTGKTYQIKTQDSQTAPVTAGSRGGNTAHSLMYASSAAYNTPVKIDFDITSAEFKEGATSLTITNYSIGISLYDKTGTRTSYCWILSQFGDPTGKHFTIYASAPTANYVGAMNVACYVASALSQAGTLAIALNNIRVESVTEVTDFLHSRYVELFHVGTDLYKHKEGTDEYTIVYNNMNSQRSVSWQFEKLDENGNAHENLYLIDGKTYLEYDSLTDTIQPVNGNGKIPVVTIAKTPSGGGTPYYALNRLQPGFEERFIGDGTSNQYYLSFSKLDTTPVRAWVMNQSTGDWQELEEGTGFRVNRNLGLVEFTTPPWNARTSGEDNVKIIAYRTIERYDTSIDKCSFGTLFGVGGTSDRLFLSGNPEYRHYDFFSEANDPTYFPDINYSTLGVSAAAIKGYARVNNYLATFKDDSEPSQSVFIREGDLTVDDNNVSNATFRLVNTLQGNGAISPYTFEYLQTEPLFLTKSGVYAITAQDITGEKYGQSRSFYLNGKLLEEIDLDNAYSIVYKDQYILAINKSLYILDGLQSTRTDRSEPYSTRQYAGFYCTGIDANVMWEYDDSLWFGTHDGKACKFYDDEQSLDSYNDDREPIYCCWETPDLDGKLFYKNKTFRYFAVRLAPSLKTSIKMFSKKLGAWSSIKEQHSIGVIFDFETIDFEDFSFSTDTSERVAHSKLRVKKVDKARFKVENDGLNESFGIYDLALEYIESGNYKG